MRTLALCLSLGFASPAFAELTAEQVLADQLNLLSGYGQLDIDAQGTVSRPDGLSVDRFVGTYVNEDDGDTVTFTVPGVDLIERADGSVQVSYPERWTVAISSPNATDPQDVTMTFDLQDVVHLVSGTEDSLQHDLKARRIAFVSVDGVPEEDVEDVDFTFFLDGLDSTLRFVEGAANARNLTFALDEMRMAAAGEGLGASTTLDEELGATVTQAETIDMTISMTGANGTLGYVASDIPVYSMDAIFDRIDWTQKMETVEEGEIQFNMSTDDFALAYDIALSIAALEESFPDAIRSGQYAKAEMRYGASEFDFQMNIPDGPVRMTSSNGAADLSFGLSSEGLSLSTSAQDTTFDLIGPQVPGLPISQGGYQVGSVGYGLTMPLLPSDDPQPFAFDFLIEGLTVSEGLWNLFDADQRLPRDPVDLVLDLSGTTVLAEDPFLVEEGDVPFTKTEATLNALRLAGAGAILTGEGSVIDTSTPDKPSGIGTLSAALTGGNTLLDTLIEMGLVTTDQAMGARMMLGVVARPGDGPDTLVSEIEVNEEGHIFANGQRIK